MVSVGDTQELSDLRVHVRAATVQAEEGDVLRGDLK